MKFEQIDQYTNTPCRVREELQETRTHVSTTKIDGRETSSNPNARILVQLNVDYNTVRKTYGTFILITGYRF